MDRDGTEFHYAPQKLGVDAHVTAKADGKLLGQGFGCFLESARGAPAGSLRARRAQSRSPGAQ